MLLYLIRFTNLLEGLQYFVYLFQNDVLYCINMLSKSVLHLEISVGCDFLPLFFFSLSWWCRRWNPPRLGIKVVTTRLFPVLLPFVLRGIWKDGILLYSLFLLIN